MKLDWQDFGPDTDGVLVWGGWHDETCYILSLVPGRGGIRWRCEKDNKERPAGAKSVPVAKGVAKTVGAALGAAKRAAERDAAKRAKDSS